ncbi:MAG: ComF family protein, partial [Promethearchaeota archaeon]
PAFSDIVFNSKSGPLHKKAISNYIIVSRIQQLRIISNFYVNYLKNVIGSLNYSEIIPVPAKSKYSFNSVEIISKEFSNVFDIPVNLNRIKRTDENTKEYAVISENGDLSSKTILLIDDIITDGETKDKISLKLREKGCNNVDMITLARTDNNIYEYNE